MALDRDRYDDTAPDAPRARIFRNTYSFEPGIKFIGVWDTVGSRACREYICGLPASPN